MRYYIYQWWAKHTIRNSFVTRGIAGFTSHKSIILACNQQLCFILLFYDIWIVIGKTLDSVSMYGHQVPAHVWLYYNGSVSSRLCVSTGYICICLPCRFGGGFEREYNDYRNLHGMLYIYVKNYVVVFLICQLHIFFSSIDISCSHVSRFH